MIHTDDFPWDALPMPTDPASADVANEPCEHNLRERLTDDTYEPYLKCTKCGGIWCYQDPELLEIALARRYPV